MKVNRLFLFSLVLLLSCSDKNDPAPITTVGSFTIGSDVFDIMEVKATDIGSGLEIVIGTGDQKITFLTEDKSAETYSFVFASSEIPVDFVAVGGYNNADDFYAITDGSVSLHENGDGKISLDFSFTAKNSSGVTVSATDGKVTSLAIDPVVIPSGQCLVKELSRGSIYYYNDEGNLVRVVYGPTQEWYVWSENAVVHKIATRDKAVTRREDWLYTNGQLSKVEIDIYNAFPGETKTINYTLNAAGQPTEVANITHQGLSGGSRTYTYDADGNYGEATNGNPQQTQVVSEYDDQPNWYSPIASSLGVAFLPTFIESHSTNNLGRSVFGGATDLYTYTYDAQGNVVTRVWTRDGTPPAVYETLTISYVGCN